MCTKTLNLCVLGECLTLLRTFYCYLCWKICCMLTAYTPVVLFSGPFRFQKYLTGCCLNGPDLSFSMCTHHVMLFFFLSFVPLIYFIFFVCACACCQPLCTHSSRKQSSRRGSVTGSIPQLPSTPKPSLLRCKLTSTLQTGPSPRQPMGPSPLLPPASTSHLLR